MVLSQGFLHLLCEGHCLHCKLHSYGRNLFLPYPIMRYRWTGLQSWSSASWMFDESSGFLNILKVSPSCGLIWWPFTCWLEPDLQDFKGHRKINLSCMHCNWWVLWRSDRFSSHFLQLWGSMFLCHLKCSSHFCFVPELMSACLRFRRVFSGFHGQSWDGRWCWGCGVWLMVVYIWNQLQP